jgi:hypothetical protein
MKLWAPLLALVVALFVSAPQAQADNKKPAALGTASKVISDESWDDAIYEDDAPAPDAPAVPPTQSMSPGQSMSPSDVEVVPPGGSANPLSGSGTIMRQPVRTVPAWTKTPALDEAYEGIIDDTVGLVLNPDCPHLSRDCGCLPPPWAHRTGMFGEYLFLRPRNTDLTYAMPESVSTPSPPVPGGPTTVLSPSGKVGNLDPNYSSGFRAGYTRAIDETASIRGTYTYYRNSARDSLTATPGNSLVSLVAYPVPSYNFGYAEAASSLGFQFADLDLRKLVSYSEHYAINYSIGGRYVHLNGGLNVQQAGSLSGKEFIGATSNFDGGGIRFGLDGDHFARRGGLMGYWRTGASFIGGQFRADYNDTYLMPEGPVLVTSHWNGGRLVTILEAEIGVGWSSKSQRMRFRAGYLVNGWFNTVGPGSYLGAVQSSNFGRLSRNFSLDGLTASAEWRF